MNDETRDTITSSDHDIIIEVRTELKGMRADLKNFSDDTKERLVRVEEGKLSKEEFGKFQIEDTKLNDDKERRLRFLERWGWTAWGAGWIIQFVLIAYLMWKQTHP